MRRARAAAARGSARASAKRRTVEVPVARRLPRPLARRDVLYSSETPAAQLTELGDGYSGCGLFFDAVEFYARAHDRAGLGKIHDIAIRQGDAFLLRRVQETMPNLVTALDWKTLGDAAKALGKETYVARAERGGAPPAPPLQEEATIPAPAEDAGPTEPDEAANEA
jgi:hypothetical protein